MYSKNDYRYYREARLVHSDDFLAHYGVKGMKWHKHTKLSYDGGTGLWTDATHYVNNKGKVISLSRFSKTSTGETGVGIAYTNANKKMKRTPSYNKVGRVSTVNTGNSTSIVFDTTTKKKRKKAAQRNAKKLIKAGSEIAKATGDIGVVYGYYNTMKKRAIAGRQT